MSNRSILAITVLLCAQEAFTRYATLNVNLNLSARVSDGNDHLTEEMVRICMKETQLSMAELERFKTNEILDGEVDESTQCFAHCIYEQMGVVKNGVFVDNDDTHKLVLTVDNENADFAVCRSIRGNNKCDTAYKIHQCIQKVKYGARDQSQPMVIADTNVNRSSGGGGDDNDNDDEDSTDNDNGQ